MYHRIFKRLFDLILSLSGLIILSPVLFLICLFQVFEHGTRPFFFQTRAGLCGKPFKVMKFKTMNDRKDENGKLLPDEIRITKIGRVLRTFSLDEIPQLLNVIFGEMSLIGPRPLPMSYVARYNDVQRRRLEVRPGITGYAQVNGRNFLDWNKRFALDVHYVENLTFRMDISIIMKTIGKVLKQDGVLPDGKSSVDTFKGDIN